MKLSLAFFAGALLVTCAVIWAGGKPVGMFLAGSFVACVIAVSLLRAVGFARVGRFILALDRAIETSVARPRRVKPVTDEMLSRRYDRMSRTQRKKIETEVWNDLQDQQADELDALTEGAANPGPRETAQAAKVVSFKNREMLNTVQQEVLSALVNLGMPMVKAQRSIIDASRGRPGIDFDTLFKMCVWNPQASQRAIPSPLAQQPARPCNPTAASA